MKRFLSLGLVLFFSLNLSSTGYAEKKDSKKVSNVSEVNSVLAQAQILTNLNEMTSACNEGGYQYYKDNSSSIEKIRSFSMDDRTEIQILNDEGKWRLAQIRNNKTGVIAHYKNREFIEYTVELPGNIIAHYKDDHPVLEKHPHFKKADFFTKFTYLICSEKEVCLNSQKIALKINTNNAIRFIIKRPHKFFSKTV